MKTITNYRRAKHPTQPKSRDRLQALDTAPTTFPSRIKHILVPLDFSTPSEKALEYAVSLAKQFGAKLTLLNVVEPIATPDFAYFPLAMENDKVMAQAKQELERVRAKVGIDKRLVEKILVRNGAAYREITNAAKTLKVDLIVISTHGYSGLAHVFMGSTAERVVRHAECPVLVVRGRPAKSNEHDQNETNERKV
jgi:universal stress protein A